MAINCDPLMRFEGEQSCMQDSEGTRFVRHTIYDQVDGDVERTFDTGFDMLTPFAPVGAASPCAEAGGPDIEQFCMEDDNGKFLRHIVYDETGEVLRFYDTELDMVTPYFVSGDVKTCASDGSTVSTEIGCLSEAATLDLVDADRCAATRVIIGGVTSFINVPLNWTTQELVDAVNAENPGSLTIVNGQIVRLDGQTSASMEIICDATSFTEDFGAGGSEGARLTSPNTTYTFKNTGAIGDGFYGLTTFSDAGLTGPTSYNTANDTITADALGDPNGNAFIVNADFPPGEFYRQPISGLTAGLEYSVQFYIINTNDRARNDIDPNVSVSVVDTVSSIEIGSFETGDIARNDAGEWSRFAFDFTATSTDVEFVLVNNAPGGRGNDLAIDQIEFAAITRQSIEGIDVTTGDAVEIVKIINVDGDIEALRVFSADGQIEYEIPDPDGKVLATGQCGANASNLVSWAETLCDDQGDRVVEFQRLFTSLNDVVTSVDLDFDDQPYEPIGDVGSCGKERCMKSKQDANFTSDFTAIEGAVPGSSDPVTATIDGPMDGIFATITMDGGTTWGSGSSGGQVVTGVRIPGQTGEATITFDFPDACEGIIDVSRTRLNFWDLDGQGGSVNQEFVQFDTPFDRVSDNLLIMDAPTNTIVGGVPGANAEHNWVEWDGLQDVIGLDRSPEAGLLPRGNILLEGIEIDATVIAIYTGRKDPDGVWRYYDYRGVELEDPILLARLRPCGETICSDEGGEGSTQDRELICYTTTAQTTPQLAWARHDDSLLGMTGDNIDPDGGIAYFTATNPVTELDLSTPGLAFVACAGEGGTTTTAEVEQTILCAEGDRFVRHTVYQGGAIINTFDTLLDMTTPISVTEAAVERCQPRDVEIVTMCEPGGTSFLRHITRDLYDNQVTVRDTSVDGFTTHSASGNEIPCGSAENVVKPAYLVIDGAGTWNSPANVHSVSVSAAEVGDITQRPTLTTFLGTEPLYEGYNVTFGTHEKDAPFAASDVVITTTHADDLLFINYTVEV